LAESPLMTIGEVAPVPVNPPGLLVTVYEVIVPDPLELVKATLIVSSLITVATRELGGPGTVVTASAEDATDVPIEFVAVIVNEYGVFDDRLFNKNVVAG